MNYEPELLDQTVGARTQYHSRPGHGHISAEEARSLMLFGCDGLLHPYLMLRKAHSKNSSLMAKLSIHGRAEGKFQYTPRPRHLG